MDFRKITKAAVKIVAVNAIGFVATKVILSTLPKTEKFKLAAMAGELIGGAVVGKIEHHLDKAVDDFFDTRIEGNIEYEETA
jgi:hypothetical protein